MGQHARIQNQPPQPKGKKPWVNIPEWWVNIKQNGGSTWSRTYTIFTVLSEVNANNHATNLEERSKLTHHLSLTTENIRGIVWL